MIAIDEHDYQDAVNILEELRNDMITCKEDTYEEGVLDITTRLITDLNKALKLLTGDDYE